MQAIESHQSTNRRFITPGQASTLLGVTISRVSRLCHTGQIAHFRIGLIKYPYLDSVLEYKGDKRRLIYAPKHGEKMPTYLKVTDPMSLKSVLKL